MEKELAFKLDPESRLSKQYMASWEQEKIFFELAKKFFIKYFDTDEVQYRMTPTLYCSCKTEGQVCKKTYRNLYQYKVNSDMQKAWTLEVVSRVNMDAIGAHHLWWWNCIDRGSYTLWHHKNIVYGHLTSSGRLDLPKGATQIKMSEYYAVIEDSEADNSEDI